MKSDKNRKDELVIFTKQGDRSELPQHNQFTIAGRNRQQEIWGKRQNRRNIQKENCDFIQYSVLKTEKFVLLYTYKEVIPMIS